MKPGFLPGVSSEISVIVTDEMCPAFNGVVLHRCYSTWSLVHHMEIAARKVLVDFLEPHEEGLGVHVSVDHLAPCGVGKTVRVRAELVSFTCYRALCEITAFEGARLLARGKQVQVVMTKEAVHDIIERS